MVSRSGAPRSWRTSSSSSAAAVKVAVAAAVRAAAAKVAAAKVALESIVRAMAVELAPFGIRSNVVQAGITDTPALQAIPGSDHLKANARSRNPLGRLTTPRDVANVIYLLSLDDAAWINGEVIRVDGGEHISGAIR